MLTGIAHAADYPAWWTNRGVIAATATTNDFIGVTAGQVKWIASNAYAELEEYVPGGAGTGVAAVIAGFTASNNYLGVNAGQLKNVAAPFWDRLIAVGYTSSYPWTTATTDDVSFAGVNIGQVKFVFGFNVREDVDGDGLLDLYENGTGLYVGPTSTGSSASTNDTDGDLLLDGAEVANRTDPNNSDTTKPDILIVAPVSGGTWRGLP